MHCISFPIYQLRFCAGSNPARDVSEVSDGEDLCRWFRLEIRLNTFRWSTIPQKQFINIITGPSKIFPHSKIISEKPLLPFIHKLMVVMTIMMMMNYGIMMMLSGITDRQKAFSLISSRDHYQNLHQSRI